MGFSRLKRLVKCKSPVCIVADTKKHQRTSSFSTFSEKMVLSCRREARSLPKVTNVSGSIAFSMSKWSFWAPGWRLPNCSQNGSNMGPKWVQNGSQNGCKNDPEMVPRSGQGVHLCGCQNASKMVPDWSQHET